MTGAIRVLAISLGLAGLCVASLRVEAQQHSVATNDAQGSMDARELVRLYDDWGKALDRMDALMATLARIPVVKDCRGCSEKLSMESDEKLVLAFDYLTNFVGKRGWISAEVWGDEAEHAGIDLLGSRLVDTKRDGSAEAIAFAKSVLPDIRVAVLQRDGSANGYALIADQIELFEGRQQIYGSMFDCVDGKFAPYALLEPDKLNERRASIGLDPIEQHRYSRNKYMQDVCASVAAKAGKS